MKLPFKLSQELEGKFKVVGTTLPILHSRIGEIDLRSATLDQAEALIKAGTDFLIRVPVKKTKAV
jgi:hypothetical protein